MPEGVQVLVVSVLILVALIFLLGLIFVFFKYGRDRDRWTVVDEDRRAREELLNEKAAGNAPGPGRPGSL
jgi:uncharacterized protein HemY